MQEEEHKYTTNDSEKHITLMQHLGGRLGTMHENLLSSIKQ
jgi:hypothetical protein